MTSCMVARVGAHADVAGLAQHSSVPVINALSNDFHPLQTIADFLTIHETFPGAKGGVAGAGTPPIVPPGLKIAWVGDANNVLFDLAIASAKLGVHIAVATPRGYGIPAATSSLITAQATGSQTPGTLTQHEAPEEAVKDADIIVTDTWVSMGQEDEARRRLQDFAGFQVTEELARRGGAKPGWKFMHCLPRHAEEVADEVFYSPRSLVFPEAENRLWAAVGTSSTPYLTILPPSFHTHLLNFVYPTDFHPTSCSRGLRREQGKDLVRMKFWERGSGSSLRHDKASKNAISSMLFFHTRDISMSDRLVVCDVDFEEKTWLYKETACERVVTHTRNFKSFVDVMNSAEKLSRASMPRNDHAIVALTQVTRYVLLASFSFPSMGGSHLHFLPL